MVKKLLLSTFVMVSVTVACTSQTATTTGASNAPNAPNAEKSAADAAQGFPSNTGNAPVAADSQVFLGSLGDSRVEIKLTRDGDRLSGTYLYEKVGKDLKLTGSIDKNGNFTLQETDAAGAKTGEWKGTWKTNDRSGITLVGKWKSPKGKPELDFSADELKTEFTGGAKIVNKYKTEADKSKYSTITNEYPELVGAAPAGAAKFNEIINKIVAESNRSYKELIADLNAEEVKPFAEYGLYNQTTYDVETANDDVISVTMNEASFTGGAHGSSSTTTVNFDLKNNRELKLADLFEPNSNYLKTLSEMTRADLKRQKLDQYGDEMLNEGTTPKEENFDSWNLTKKGLKFNFDAYQVASYAEGPQTVVIPYDKLKAILKKDGAAAAMMAK